MIFREELAQLVVEGRKTATRRLQVDKPTSPWHREKCAYKVGQRFTINPGRGVDRCGEAIATDVYEQPLGAATSEDAKREGFGSLLAFRDAFLSINGKRGKITLATMVWAVEFELAAPEAPLHPVWRRTLQRMSTFSKGMCRTENAGVDESHMEQLAAGGFVRFVSPAIRGSVYRLTEEGRREAKRGKWIP